VAPDPIKPPDTAAFAATQLAPLLRALADPEGKGDLSADQAASIELVEANLARLAEKRQ
jgi:hypothetical protein